jgi:hypothetical protein
MTVLWASVRLSKWVGTARLYLLAGSLAWAIATLMILLYSMALAIIELIAIVDPPTTTTTTAAAKVFPTLAPTPSFAQPTPPPTDNSGANLAIAGLFMLCVAVCATIAGLIRQVDATDETHLNHASSITLSSPVDGDGVPAALIPTNNSINMA